MLEVKGISKHYKNKQILNGISFAAGPGQCVGIAGGNGCGKTTLLSILAGVNRPDRGSICFDGMEAVGNRKVFERNAAYVPQENPLIPELTARDNYRLWFKGDKAELERDLEEGVGKFLGLTEFLGTPAGKLSGGQKRRVAIAGVLAMRPEMMILDEPTAGLDPQGRDEILDQIERLNRRYGLTILLVSHSMEDVARYVDRRRSLTIPRRKYLNIIRNWKTWDWRRLRLPMWSRSCGSMGSLWMIQLRLWKRQGMRFLTSFGKRGGSHYD